MTCRSAITKGIYWIDYYEQSISSLGFPRCSRYLSGMTETEQSILRELLAFEAAVASLPTANPKPKLVEHFQRLDALTAQLPTDAPGELLHYLHKKSYEKARLFLQGRDAENAVGNCRR